MERFRYDEFFSRCEEEIHPKARFARSTQKMVLNIDEHIDVTTDISAEVVYDAEVGHKLDDAKKSHKSDANDFVSGLIDESTDFDDEE